VFNIPSWFLTTTIVDFPTMAYPPVTSKDSYLQAFQDMDNNVPGARDTVIATQLDRSVSLGRLAPKGQYMAMLDLLHQWSKQVLVKPSPLSPSKASLQPPSWLPDEAGPSITQILPEYILVVYPFPSAQISPQPILLVTQTCPSTLGLNFPPSLNTQVGKEDQRHPRHFPEMLNLVCSTFTISSDAAGSSYGTTLCVRNRQFLVPEIGSSVQEILRQMTSLT
jgi:hypothetical protein